MVKKIIYIALPFALLIFGYVFFYSGIRQETNSKSEVSHLVVYTYSSFSSSWGAGPKLKELFYKQTGINVDFRDIGEAGVLLQRLSLEGEKTEADIVMGLDQFSIKEALSQEKWLGGDTVQRNWNPQLPEEDRVVESFNAYNWSPLTFIYRASELSSFESLSEFSKYKKIWSLMDPRTSSPGFVFFHWILQKYGVHGAREFFKKNQKSILTISPSWSSGYGLFTKKQARVVFSYLTSPAYHWIEEKNTDYQPMYLSEELPYQVEYMGILANCKNCEEAKKFRDFILSSEAQKIILFKNYMFPVVDGLIQNTDFSNLKSVRLFKPKKYLSKKEVVESWKTMEL